MVSITDGTGISSEMVWVTPTVPGMMLPVSSVYSLNNKVACAPFPSNVVEKETRGGMVVPKQKGTMTELCVKFTCNTDSVSFIKNDKVWVRAETFTLQWAKDVYDLNGDKFILVPVDQIVLAEKSASSHTACQYY